MTYTPTAVKGVQQFQFNYGVGNTDQAITAVNASYTMLLASFASNDASGFPCGTGLAYATLLNGSTVRTVTAAAGSAGSCTAIVVELVPTMLRQAVQYGTITMNGVGSASAGITAVGPRAFLIPLGYNENIAGAQTTMGSVTCRLWFASTTAVTAGRTGAGGVSAPDIMVASFCVVDPK